MKNNYNNKTCIKINIIQFLIFLFIIVKYISSYNKYGYKLFKKNNLSFNIKKNKDLEYSYFIRLIKDY